MDCSGASEAWVLSSSASWSCVIMVMTEPTVDDVELAARLRAGDETAFAGLVDAYGPALRRLARCCGASDAWVGGRGTAATTTRCGSGATRSPRSIGGGPASPSESRHCSVRRHRRRSRLWPRRGLKRWG